jgi:signal transduction histidine kinase
MGIRKLHDLVTPDQRDDLRKFVEDVFHDGFGQKEFVFRAKTGKEINMEMVATTVGGLDGLEALACCFSRDMTDRKRLEEDLIQSDRLAIMGQMAAGIAHEINNPLGIILANAEDAIGNHLDAQSTRESLESIERNAVRAGKTIEDLLSFTRPHPPERVSIDLPQLIDESLSFLKQKLKQKKIKVEKSFPDDPVVILGDENLLQQLLINLLLNSTQAMQHGGKLMIRVAVHQNGKDGRITLEVEDTGAGIPDNDLPKIFDPFFTSRKEKGFGLGLFTSRIIVEKHQGTLSAKSELGRGTVMTVEMPAETGTIPGITPGERNLSST